MSILPKEKEERKKLIEQIESIGWEDGKKYLPEFKEHTIITAYYIKPIFLKSIKDINSSFFAKLTPEEETKIIEDINIAIDSPNEIKILDYLKYGIEIIFKKQREIIYLIDYENIGKNKFFYLHEAKFKGSPENIEPDITFYINGLPVGIIEDKKETTAYSYIEALEQIKRYEKQSLKLFKYVQFGVAYGDEIKYVSTLPNYEKQDWEKKIYVWKENKKENIFGFLRPERVIEFIKYFIFFEKTQKGTNKLIGRYIQYFSAQKSLQRIKEYFNGNNKNKGLIWHWQGSGKTYTMFFIANMFFDKYYANSPIVFFLMDRKELIRQFIKEINKIENFKFKNHIKKVDKTEDLIEIIKNVQQTEQNTNVIYRGLFVSTIQKFKQGNGEEKESLKKLVENYKHVNKKEILFLIDEVQRTQYGELAAMTKCLFPNALRFGFTGTPIMKNEKDTFNEFSYPKDKEFYLHRYFIGDSIDDNFTLPLTYKLIKEKDIDILLSEDSIKSFIEDYKKRNDDEIEADFDIDIPKKQIKEYINKSRLFLINDLRIQKIADLIKDQIENDTENFKFKVMVVATNRLGCVRYKKILDKVLISKFGDNAKNWTEIVMTYSNDDSIKEIMEYKEELYRRKGQVDLNNLNKDIQEDFIEKENPKILIVTDMLLTGFDAPHLKVMYLDKPIYGHKLLQAIARTNRPYPDKKYGLIVDSIGVLQYITETMEFYNEFEKDEQKDLENLLKKVDSLIDEFENILNNLKNYWCDLKIDNNDVSIDIENIKELLKRKNFTKEYIEEKISIIAIYSSSQPTGNYTDEQIKAIKLVNDIKKVIKLYTAIGAHSKKINYSDDIEILSFLYTSIIKKQIKNKKGKSANKEFLKEISNYVNDRVIIDEMEEVAEIEINREFIEKLSNSSKDKIKKSPIVDYYFVITNDLLDNLKDPIYKEIYNRITLLKENWINRDLAIKEFLKKFGIEVNKKEEYDKSIKNKPLKERIIESLNVYINDTLLERFNKKLQLKETNEILKQIISDSQGKELTETQKKKLSESLLLDIFQEAGENIKGDYLTKIDNIINELVDNFIMPLLKE